MAVLEKIRNRMGILVSLVIGLALIAFVLSDLLTGGHSVLTNNQFQIAEINGKKIKYQELDQIINQVTEVYKFNTGQPSLDEDMMHKIREQSWQQLVDQYVLGQEYDALGLSVCSKELLDMVHGTNPHPYIRELFTNPETGLFNRAAVIQFIKSLENETDPARKNYWLFIENLIIRERYLIKYQNLIRKGLYVTTQQVNKDINDNKRKVSFSFLNIRYNSIADSLIPVKMSELKNYLKEHAKAYEQEASRDIEYIVFEIVPSADDYANAKNWIEENKQEFFTTSEVKSFVNINSDVPFNEKYQKIDELHDSIKILYHGKIGDHVGPFFYDNAYIMARLVDVKNLPDSVRARHILIRPENNTKEAYDKAKTFADSLFNVLKKNKTKFEEFAKTYSKDGTASKGGDLGWFRDGQNVKAFNDACFNGKLGEIQLVETQYGFHILEVTGRGKEIKKAQVAIVERKVEPSSLTQQAIYQKASAFAGTYNTGEKFIEGLKKQGITPMRASHLTENMREVPGIPNSRELVRWSFKAKPNSISGIMELGDKFVIARLVEAREKGVANVEQIKDQLITLVRKEKKAKQIIERLNQQIASNVTLTGIAQKENVSIDSVINISFASYALPTVGFEPGIIAVASISPLNKITGPIKGNNGVYVLQVYAENIEEVANKDMVFSRIQNNYTNRVNYEPQNVLKKLANIKDMRSKFY